MKCERDDIFYVLCYKKAINFFISLDKCKDSSVSSLIDKSKIHYSFAHLLRRTFVECGLVVDYKKGREIRIDYTNKGKELRKHLLGMRKVLRRCDK